MGNPKEIPNAFKEHFWTIWPRLARGIPLTSDGEFIYLKNTPENCNKFCFRSTSSSVIFTHLNRLSKTKATGAYLLCWFVSVLIVIISGPMCDLFIVKYLKSGIFFDDWKCARVTPLFKQGKSSDLNNYRLISVISVVAKVFERVLFDQLCNFLKTLSLNKHQSGFRSLLNCYCPS